ncbi:MAG: non-canonical purine NTP pyrophosphatase [Gracilibacter sp. BRH_c7a]|nr:MAG: non-canonical purine NTP pyrophosphatase [Gracilibacter sp. BRH_c7a]
MEILLATANKGKVIELEEMLTGMDIRVLSLSDFPGFPEIEETGATFAQNAFLKARKAAEITGLVSLADDSGLEVDALNGKPGVFSARYAGEPKSDERNIDKLLEQLNIVPELERSARFRCSLAVVAPDGQEFLAEGTVEGRILKSRKGSGGFGYDPVFFLPDMDKTMAELSLEEKNRISHRAIAFRKAVPIIQTLV